MQCEAAVKLAYIGPEKARRCDEGEMGMAQF